jgi:hypothetical protein
MGNVIDEIAAAIRTLKLPSGSMRQLPSADSERIYFAALDHFIRSGDRRWWWEDFREQATSVMFESGDGWRHIAKIVLDPDELVWFVAEENQLPHYPVFETTPRIASQVIGECYGFEYYLIAKDFRWLLCETHHNRLLAIGFPVQERLEHYA